MEFTHYAIATEVKDHLKLQLIQTEIFDTEKAAEEWAKKNLKGKYYEIFPDCFVN